MSKILITGANRGIGYHLARAFLAHGDEVIATHRSAEMGERLTRLKDEYPSTLRTLQLDVTRPEERQQAFERLQFMTGYLDVIINNAGIMRPSRSIFEIDADDLRASFEVNTIAPIIISKNLLPFLEGSKRPRVVNITLPTRPVSELQRTEQHHYVVCRYALNSLTKMMALELGHQGITTIALYPGYIKTDMNAHAEAATDPLEVIPPLVDLIHGLTEERNGECLLPDGQAFAW